ncbi:MAG: alpha/beta fold hydrolase [Acidimicrobiia bacterium]|nr:alpha/beta fold hydrolase [Acidimicrobiia bacterium]
MRSPRHAPYLLGRSPNLGGTMTVKSKHTDTAAIREESKATPMAREFRDPTTRVKVSDRDELDVWVMGEGTPIVFVHGAMTRDLLTPLIDELANKGRYQLIHYGRRGHGGRGLPGEATDIPGQARDVVTVLDALRIDRAHVAGHSIGAMITLELAMRVPHRLRSAILLEHGFFAQVRTEASKQVLKEGDVLWPQLIEMYMSGETERAATTVWDVTSGIEGSRELIEPVLPANTLALAARDLNTFLQVELAHLGSWMVDPVTVQEITTPIAWVSWADTAPLFRESGTILREWLPNTDAIEIVRAQSHYFPTLNPTETATALDEWLQTLGSSG